MTQTLLTKPIIECGLRNILSSASLLSWQQQQQQHPSWNSSCRQIWERVTAHSSNSSEVRLNLYGCQHRRWQHVTLVPRAQKSGEGQPISHRWLRVPPPLPGHRHVSAGLHLHRDDAPVHRVAHHVCPHTGDPKRRAQHILLDTPNLHTLVRPLEAGGRWRATSWNRQNARRQGQEARQVLPVGRLLPLLPGKLTTIFCF